MEANLEGNGDEDQSVNQLGAGAGPQLSLDEVTFSILVTEQLKDDVVDPTAKHCTGNARADDDCARAEHQPKCTIQGLREIPTRRGVVNHQANGAHQHQLHEDGDPCNPPGNAIAIHIGSDIGNDINQWEEEHSQGCRMPNHGHGACGNQVGRNLHGDGNCRKANDDEADLLGGICVHAVILCWSKLDLIDVEIVVAEIFLALVGLAVGKPVVKHFLVPLSIGTKCYWLKEIFNTIGG